MNIELLKGVGSSTASLLKKINIFTINDLLEYYPYRYNYIKFLNLNDLVDNSGYIEVTVVTEPKVFYVRRNFNILSFQGEFNNNVFKVVIYNRAFLKNNLKLNKKIVLFGKYDKLKNTFNASDIKFDLSNNTIEPIYHLINGLKTNTLNKLIKEALKINIKLNDYIPEIYNQKYNFISKDKCVQYIHEPKNINDIKSAKLKLIYEELFGFMFKVNYLKKINTSLKGIKRNVEEKKLNKFIEDLPFNLTSDQIKAINEIKIDMLSSKRMNRLLLGDVGSGKTLVAIYAIYLNYLSGFQSAFMAPTEILAKQHYETLNILFDNDIKIELLTGKTTKKEKNEINKKLKNHEIDLIIGTHALISGNVEFNNLGLVITDEQHRFGVKQRNDLENKGNNPDVLYLSATPIPRSYALIIYGDSDVSMIKTKPEGRKEIITKTLMEKDIKICLTKMYEEIIKGNQVFVVSPLIEDNGSDLNDINKLKDNLENAFKNKAKIKIIHGKMKNKDKEEIMEQFQNHEFDILISTTVIEVGINIPNATIMTIFNAERFGLATLHQLRGRVGRSDKESFCFLISKSDNKRLKVMEESNDGFYITEKDFEQRREGDLFGTKQSGDMVFKMADLKRDYEILLQCNKDSEEYIDSKDYLNNSHYNDIVKRIEFLN